LNNVTFIPKSIIEDALAELVKMNILFYERTSDGRHSFILNPNRANKASTDHSMLLELFMPDPMDDYDEEEEEIEIANDSRFDG
jgi:hypothetical protein